MEPQTTQSQPLETPATTSVTTPAPLQAPVTSSPFGRVALYSVLFLTVGFVGGFYTPGLLNPVAEQSTVITPIQENSHALTNVYSSLPYYFSLKYPKGYTYLQQQYSSLAIGDASSTLTITITPHSSVKYKTQKEACAGVEDDGGCPLSQELINAEKKVLDEATTTSKTIIPIYNVEGSIFPVKGGFAMTSLRRSWQSGYIYARAVMFNKFGDMIVLEQELNENDIDLVEKNPTWTTFKNIAKTLEVKN